MSSSELSAVDHAGPPAYERDPCRVELATTVLATGLEGDRPYAVLEDTICFPEGGGQPADRATLHAAGAIIDVLDVQRRDGERGREVRHFLSAPVNAGSATLRLDWQRRYDLMQQHTAQHLLSAIAADRFGWPTTSFHLGPEVCDVELDVPSLSQEQLATLEDAIAAEVRAARPVSARRVPHGEYLALGERVRSRGLPEGHSGDVRLVEIEGVDLNTCGGTHLRSTAEIEALKLLGTERLRGGTRLFWVAGARVRCRLGLREEQAAALRGIVGAGDEDLVATARQKIERLEDADRRIRALAKELASSTATALLGEATDGGGVLVRHFPDQDAGFVQELARGFSAGSGARLALVTSGSGERLTFALAATVDCAVDVRRLGAQIATLLEGRGGGAGRVFQGKAGSLARVEEARALLERAFGGA